MRKTSLHCETRRSTDLLWIGEHRFQLAQEDLGADLLIEVSNADSKLLGLELLDSLNEDFCSGMSKSTSSTPLVSLTDALLGLGIEHRLELCTLLLRCTMSLAFPRRGRQTSF